MLGNPQIQKIMKLWVQVEGFIRNAKVFFVRAQFQFEGVKHPFEHTLTYGQKYFTNFNGLINSLLFYHYYYYCYYYYYYYKTYFFIYLLYCTDLPSMLSRVVNAV